ncbi:bifunctional helix-turn-helix transcriptional regulator/GNAT family N-acetyltransferase [Chondrinema litorale]|uniref:bifunctional helix-turn-helix transcriptional regulator/GNAT family N-acetyltransferase n=1 Tax=Chondrinema litorale TaxID=2994555 RepID=UPI002542D882|nr:helix-turn-helix domain-containing GNAT family N-acetyltransferase [Chondrinema litorale]UZR97794.1 helix-turn-helix domain-containing GNAT family N-acetyltransferase [Chondrinema litorale]
MVVQQIRAFNRFYTNFLGLVNNKILNSPLSLSESRVLYELGQKESIPTAELLVAIQIDKGYLSRILKKFEKEGLIVKSVSVEDKRVQNLSLTLKGKDLFDEMTVRSEEQIEHYTNHLTTDAKEELAGMFKKSEMYLNKQQADPELSLSDINIRTTLESGDMGFVIQTHGEMYKSSMDFGLDFEYYVVKSMAEFYENYNPETSRVWVCEHNKKKIGFLCLFDRGNNTAQLRYFFIFPAYRGIGLGKKMMQLYMDFMQEKGFKKAFLLTTEGLPTAASLYTRNGFELVEEKTTTTFGREIIERKYEMHL